MSQVIIECTDTAQALTLNEIVTERRRQEAKCQEGRREGLEWQTCADPRMSDETKLAVLVEEVGEVSRELCDARAEIRRPSENLRVELIQVAAVAMAWAESLVDELMREEDVAA